MNIQPSKYYKSITPNHTNALYGLALEQKDCIFLTGSCPTSTPPAIYRELLKSFTNENQFCSYNVGMNQLKKLIADYIKQRSGVSISPSKNILITLGSTTFLQQIFLYLLDEDSECIVVTPTFQDYFNQLRFTRCSITEIPMNETETSWDLDIGSVEQAVTDKTKIILLCSPNNPTGKVYSRDDLIKLGHLAQKHNIFLVADEAYNYLTYKKNITSLLEIPEIANNVIVVRTFSKEFSMCGWRVGYTYVPEQIYDDLFHLQLSFNTVAPAISQKAAIISLKSEEAKDMVVQEIQRIQRNRDFVMASIDAIGKDLSYIIPDSCPYLFVKYTKSIDSYDLCKDIISKSKVLVSPGIGNGKGGEHHFCITFLDSMDVVKEGVTRLARYFDEYYDNV